MLEYSLDTLEKLLVYYWIYTRDIHACIARLEIFFFVGEKIGLDKTFLYFKYSLQVRIYALFSGIEGLVERAAGHQMSMNLYCAIL